MALQIRRGPNAQRATTLLQTGEVAWTTDTKKLYVGDGVTTGGVNILANIAGTGFVWNPSSEQLDLAGSTITGINADNVAETNGIVPRLWYRSSLGKTHASEIFTSVAGAAHTGINFSWDDVNQKLTATVLTENAADAAASLFTSGTHTGISFTYGLTEDAANRIDATVSSEFIQDTVNDLFTAGVHTGITFTYSDNLNALSAAVTFPTFPTRGGNLDSDLVLNSYNITGTGNITNTGNISTTGNLTVTTTGPSLSVNNLGANINCSSNGYLTVAGITSGAVSSATIGIKGSKGTYAAPTVITTNDVIGQYVIEGYNGTVFKKATLFQATAKSAVQVNGNYDVDTFLYTLTQNGTYIEYAFRANGTFDTAALKIIPLTSIQLAPLIASKGVLVYDDTIGRIRVHNGTAFENIPTVVSAPSTATSTGIAGQIAFDASWFYVCTATNVWKRSALGSW